MRYTLFFGQHEVATISELDDDFPTRYGTFELSPDLPRKPELSEVLRYIEFSIRTWPLIEADRWEEGDADEEEQFCDLIDSNEWSLLNENEQQIPILIPIFCTQGKINWRLNPSAWK